MNKILRYLIPATLSLLIATNVGSQDLKLKATDKLLSLKDEKILQALIKACKTIFFINLP